MQGSRADVFIQSWRRSVISNHEQSRFARHLRQRQRLERQKERQQEPQKQLRTSQQTSSRIIPRRERRRWQTPRRGQSVGPSSDGVCKDGESNKAGVRVSPTYSTSFENEGDASRASRLHDRGMIAVMKLSDDEDSGENDGIQGNAVFTEERASPKGVELLQERKRRSSAPEPISIFRKTAKEDAQQENKKFNWRQQRKKTPQRQRFQENQQPEQKQNQVEQEQRPRRFRRPRRRRQRRVSQELPDFPDGVLCQQDLRQTGLIRGGQMQMHEDRLRELDSMLREIDRHQKEMLMTMEQQQTEAKELQQRIEQQIQRHVQMTRESKRALGQHWWTKVVSNRLELANAARRARTEKIPLPPDEIQEILEGVDLEEEDLQLEDPTEEKEGGKDDIIDDAPGNLLVGFSIPEVKQEETDDNSELSTGSLLVDFMTPAEIRERENQ